MHSAKPAIASIWALAFATSCAVDNLDMLTAIAVFMGCFLATQFSIVTLNLRTLEQCIFITCGGMATLPVISNMHSWILPAKVAAFLVGLLVIIRSGTVATQDDNNSGDQTSHSARDQSSETRTNK